MKNIHLLPTDKPSRLYKQTGALVLDKLSEVSNDGISINQHIYITSDEDIKDGDWVIENHTFKREPYIGKCFYPKNDGTVTDEILKRDLLSVKYEGHYETLAQKHNCKKIILTTDQDLIKDGVQAIDDEFLEWFIKNPSCEFVEVSYGLLKPFKSTEKGYMIHLPDNEVLGEPKQETLSYSEAIKKEERIFNSSMMKQETPGEAAEKQWGNVHRTGVLGFIEGANWQAQRMYSLDHMRQCWAEAFQVGFNFSPAESIHPTFKDFIEKLNKTKQP